MTYRSRGRGFMLPGLTRRGSMEVAGAHLLGHLGGAGLARLLALSSRREWVGAHSNRDRGDPGFHIDDSSPRAWSRRATSQLPGLCPNQSGAATSDKPSSSLVAAEPVACFGRRSISGAPAHDGTWPRPSRKKGQRSGVMENVGKARLPQRGETDGAVPRA
jgi:hypothetical protein